MKITRTMILFGAMAVVASILLFSYLESGATVEVFQFGKVISGKVQEGEPFVIRIDMPVSYLYYTDACKSGANSAKVYYTWRFIDIERNIVHQTGQLSSAFRACALDSDVYMPALTLNIPRREIDINWKVEINYFEERTTFGGAPKGLGSESAFFTTSPQGTAPACTNGQKATKTYCLSNTANEGDPASWLECVDGVWIQKTASCLPKQEPSPTTPTPTPLTPSVEPSGDLTPSVKPFACPEGQEPFAPCSGCDVQCKDIEKGTGTPLTLREQCEAKNYEMAPPLYTYTWDDDDAVCVKQRVKHEVPECLPLIEREQGGACVEYYDLPALGVIAAILVALGAYLMKPKAVQAAAAPITQAIRRNRRR